MKPSTVACVSISLAVLMIPGPGAADMVSIVADRDATIFGEDVDGANGTGHLFVGNNNLGSARRALVHFDLSGIPAGATITSATVRLDCTKVSIPGVARAVALHRMTKSWTEGPATGAGIGGGQPTLADLLDVTWRYASFTVAATDTFETAGGDFEAVASASISIGDIGTYDWSTAGLVSDVTGWLASPSTNHGWILVGDEAGFQTTRRFDSREGPNGPVLMVEFVPTPVDAATWGGVKALYRTQSRNRAVSRVTPARR